MTPPSTTASPSGPPLRPRLLHVIRQFLPNRGGLEEVARQLCAEQLRSGIDARVLTLDRLFVRPEEVLPGRETIDGIDVIRIPFRGSTRYPLAPGFLRHVAGFDLIHVHAVDFFFDALAATRPFHRTPLVATTHGGFFHTKAFAGLKSLWFAGPTRLSASAYDAIVACSDSDARTFERVAPGRVVTIPNGVDLMKFAGRSSTRPVRRLVTLGRFSRNKRLDRLIATMEVLRSAEAGWHLDILGLESDWSADHLRGLIAAAGLERSVTVRVGLDDDATAQVLAGASVFVSASDFEGFGLVLIEALSAGLVPLVQPNAAFRARAARQREVVLVDYADPAAAAAACRDAVARPGTGPRQAADLSCYAWSGVARRYADVYAGCSPAFRARAFAA